MKSLCRRRGFRLVSLWCFAHLTEGRTFKLRPFEMCHVVQSETRRAPRQAGSAASAITPELMSEAIAEACVRFGALGSAAKARVDRLIETSAWTDATLALVELELPQWQLRRLVYEDGEWLCSLSKQPRLPLGLDEAAEATHEILPLAILIAFLQARRAAMASATVATTVPQVRSAPSDAVCCDNFA
jgi:hypothetical protein